MTLKRQRESIKAIIYAACDMLSYGAGALKELDILTFQNAAILAVCDKDLRLKYGEYAAHLNGIAYELLHLCIENKAEFIQEIDKRIDKILSLVMNAVF